jgi:thiamine-monophosphate kinase
LIQEKLPVSEDLLQAASQLGRDPHDLFLQDSDDYELIITCSADHVDRVHSAIAGLSDVPVTEVGRITDAADGIKLILPDGTKQGIAPSGWDHFTKVEQELNKGGKNV